MTMRGVLAFFPVMAGLVISPAVLAQRCGPESDATTMCMNQRLGNAFEEADKKLNASYQRVMKQLAGPKNDDADYPAVRASLIDAQRHWVAFRDSDCAGQFTLSAGGTLRDAVLLSCKIDRTNARIKELDAWTVGD